MSNLIQYKPLFELSILHDYYLSEDLDLFESKTNLRAELLAAQAKSYKISNNIQILPTPDCKEHLKEHRLLFKPTANGFFVGARVIPFTNEKFILFKPLSIPLKLRFVVKVNNPFFFNITNLRLEKNTENQEKHIYFFTNRNKNFTPLTSDTLLYLSKSVEDFNRNYDYEAGEIIIRGNDMWEAIEDVKPDNPFESTQWRKIYNSQSPHFQFVTRADKTVLRPKVFLHQVSSNTVGLQAVRILVKDQNKTLKEDLLFEANDPRDANAVLNFCKLDLSHLPSGLYYLEVEQLDGTPLFSLNKEVYLDDLLYQQSPLAIIECDHEPDGSLNEYKWLDQNDHNVLLNPKYIIRWKNRPTWWRYYYQKDENITEASSDVAFWNPTGTNATENILMTNEPHGLTQIARRIKVRVGVETFLLPNPSVTKIFPKDGKVYSEINMGGGLGPPPSIV